MLIPNGQFDGIVRALVKFAEEAVPLLDHLVVFGERASVARIDLRERVIQIAPPVARRPKDQVEVFREKKDGIQFAQKVERMPP